MKTKLPYIVALALLFSVNLRSQAIYAVAIKGAFILDGQKIPPKSGRKIQPDKKLTLLENSKVMLYTETKLAELISGAQKIIPYNEILDKIRKGSTIKKTTMTNLFGYMAKMNENENSVKSLRGSVTAGINGWGQKNYAIEPNEEDIFPLDSSSVVSNEVQLKWSLKSRTVAAQLLVIHNQTNDTVYNAPANENGLVTVKMEKDGIYNWLLYSRLERKTKFNRVFNKPNEKDSKKIRADLEAYKSEIASLSEESQQLLLDDYLVINRIITD